MAMIRRRRLFQLTATASSLGLVRAFPSHAQDIVDNLKILVGYPPGGSNDVVARRVAGKLVGTYANVAVVDNKPGAAGRLVVDSLKSLAADGKTMLLTPSSVVTLYPHVYRQLSYDPVADFTPVAVACDQVHGLAVGTPVSQQVKTVADFVAWAKANPEKANCGNPGEGSTPHLLTFMLVRSSGAPIQAVPYRGLAPAVNDLVSGQLASAMLPDGAFLPYVSGGRARVLATTGAARSPFFPDVPTFAEQGLQTILVTEWIGFFMRAGTSEAIVSRAADAIAQALRQTDLVEAFATAGLVSAPSTPAELARRLRADRAYWGHVVNSSGFPRLE
jgi:tripartite-type tricarboxylate transporter receptor subunit TctC